MKRLLLAPLAMLALFNSGNTQTLAGFCYKDTFQRPPMTTACPSGMASTGADCVAVKPKADWVVCGPGYAESEAFCKGLSWYDIGKSGFRADYTALPHPGFDTGRRVSDCELTFVPITTGDGENDGHFAYVSTARGMVKSTAYDPQIHGPMLGLALGICKGGESTEKAKQLENLGAQLVKEYKENQTQTASNRGPQGEFVVPPCSLYGRPTLTPAPTAPIVLGAACKAQDWSVNNDRVFAAFSAPAAPHGTVQAIPRGTVSNNQGNVCRSVSWSDLNLTCSHGTWQIGGRWMVGERRIEWPNGMAWSQAAQRHQNAPATSPLAWLGNWTAYGTNTQPGPQAAAIKLLVDNGLGAPSNLYTEGPGRPLFAEDWKVTADLVQNGQRINWANGTYWVKQAPRGGVPKGPLGVEGEWQAFDPSGKPYPKLATIFWLLDAGGGAKASMADISGTAIMAPGWNLVGSLRDTNVCQSSYTPHPNLKVGFK